MVTFEKSFGEIYNSYPEENNKIIINKDDIQRSLINYMIKLNLIKNNQKINKQIFYLQANKEIKVLKNRKLVYLNKKLLNDYYTSRSIKKFRKINFITRKKTSSKYRGVSKNGSKWQVLILYYLIK
jgi:hypothetical protein